MPLTYGDQVETEYGVPPFVLDHPACPAPIREAYAAFVAANEATAAERAKCDAIRDEAEDNRTAILRAAANGEKPPAEIPASYIEERLRRAERQIAHAKARAHRAADAYEKSVAPHRADVRAIIAERLPQVTADAKRLWREARTAADEARALASALSNLDHLASNSTREMVNGQLVTRQSANEPIITRHYRALRQRDPLFNMPGRENRVSNHWADVEAYMTGLDAEAYVVDPLAEKADAR